MKQKIKARKYILFEILIYNIKTDLHKNIQLQEVFDLNDTPGSL